MVHFGLHGLEKTMPAGGGSLLGADISWSCQQILWGALTSCRWSGLPPVMKSALRMSGTASQKGHQCAGESRARTRTGDLMWNGTASESLPIKEPSCGVQEGAFSPTLRQSLSARSPTGEALPSIRTPQTVSRSAKIIVNLSHDSPRRELGPLLHEHHSKKSIWAK